MTLGKSTPIDRTAKYKSAYSFFNQMKRPDIDLVKNKSQPSVSPRIFPS